MRTIEGFRLRKVMGESVIIGEGVAQIDFNKLMALNASASYLWQSIEAREFTIDDLATLLIDKYGISTDRAKVDAASIVNEWIHNGLIQQ